MSPEVFASSRCTMPWRSAAPLVARICPAPSSPSSTVGPVQPGVGWAATPGGLSTTTMSESSYTTSRPGTVRGTGAVDTGAGSVTSSHSPAGTRSDLAAVRPPISTWPVGDQFRGARPGQPEHPGQRGVDPLTVQPVGHRHPALARPGHGVPSPDGRGAAGRSGPDALPSWPRSAARRLADRAPLPWPGPPASPPAALPPAGPAAWCRRPSREIPRAASSTASTPPHTMQESATLNTGQCGSSIQSTTCAAQEARRPEEPVPQVPGRPAEQQPERDRPGNAAQPPGGAQDGHDDAEGDQGEDDGDRGADAERGAAVTQLPQRQQAAEQPEGGPIRQGRDHDGLGHQIRNENRHGDDEQQPDPARPGRRTGAARSPVIRVASSSGPVQRRSSRCLQATQRVARGNACRRAFPIGSPQDSQTP